MQQRLGDALVQDDCIDVIVAELDRCWEVTQDQDKASKIEKALFDTQRDAKNGNYLHVQCLPPVIKGYATLRDAKLTESSYDKVVMWTGGSHDHDDVMRALVGLDRPEIRL